MQVQYLHNHNLLELDGAPRWLTIKGGRYVLSLILFSVITTLKFHLSLGSKKYVNTILSSLPENCLHLSTPVHAVRSTESGRVLLTTMNGRTEEFDHVILATHADTTLSILQAGGGVSIDEERILGGFEWHQNEVVVHSDTKVRKMMHQLMPCRPFSSLFFLPKLMPKSPSAWSSWNYIARSNIDKKGIHKPNHDYASL
jgi:predicted NAD/FAD-binding protein